MSILQFKDFGDTMKATEILKSIIYKTYQYRIIPEENSLEFDNAANAYDVQELLKTHGITTLNKFGRKTKTYYKFALKDTYSVQDTSLQEYSLLSDPPSSDFLFLNNE